MMSATWNAARIGMITNNSIPILYACFASPFTFLMGRLYHDLVEVCTLLTSETTKLFEDPHEAQSAENDGPDDCYTKDVCTEACVCIAQTTSHATRTEEHDLENNSEDDADDV